VHAGEDDIVLQAPGTYLMSQTLQLLGNVNIVGQGARVTKIDGGEDVRVFNVVAGVSATIINVTIQSGNAGTGAGGNILNAGDLTLGFVRVTGGEADTGGGIANTPGGQLAVLYSLIDGNVASGTGGGGIASTGSVDNNPAHVDVADSTLTQNVATSGGGILINGSASDAAIDYATIAFNLGGGITIASALDEADVSASLLVGNSTGNCPSAEKPVDEQYNLDDATSCEFGDPTSVSDVTSQLGNQLVNAGGGTDVLTFPASSPAVDLVAQCFSFADQRLFQRVTAFGQQPCDAGAYEQSATGPIQPTISSGPSGPTTATSASFTFSTLQSGVTFVCQLTGPGHPGGYAPCTSPVTYSGLAPGDYTFSVALADPTGQQISSPPTVRTFTVTSPAAQTPTPTPTPAPTATPVPQQDATGKVVSGKVLVKTPGGKFVPLDPSKAIPSGSEIDVTKGRIELTAILKPGGKPEKAIFYDGIFKLTLGKKTTDLTLSQPLARCKRGAAASAKKPKTRKLWGSGSGSFRTRGQYSAATVRGTTWLVQDSCAGTLTKVTKGVVSVFDQVKKRTIVLRAGKQYLAKPRR
jgi:hypothetical protein